MSTSPESLLEEVPIPTPGRAESSPASLTEARACVDWIVLAILHLNRRVGFELQTAVLIHDLVLAGASQAAMFWRHGLADQARHSLVHAWIDQSLVFEPGWKYLHDFRNEMVQGVFDADTTKLQASDLDREFLLVFTVAVSEKLVAEGAELYARQSLRHIMRASNSRRRTLRECWPFPAIPSRIGRLGERRYQLKPAPPLAARMPP
jgi:hypothetical protein